MTNGTNVVRSVAPSAPAPAEDAKQHELAPLVTTKARKLIEPMLKHGVTYERILSEVYFAIQKNPELAECTPDSLVMSVAQATKWDLEIGTLVHLVPFNVKVKVNENGREVERWQKRAQAIRDYKGDATLVIRAGSARYIDAQVVYEKDAFEYELGTNVRIVHRPAFGDRGKLRCF
jgi:recombination protein RecT